MTHPLLPYAAYAVIALFLTWYFGRSMGDVSSIKPGTTLTVLWWVKFLAALFFLGMPAILVFSLPQASHPVGATIMTTVLGLICFGLFMVMGTTRVVVKEDSIECWTLRWRSIIRYEDYCRVSIMWFNIAFERKDGGVGTCLPAVFTNSHGLYHYLKLKIEGPPRAEAAHKPVDVPPATVL